MRYWLVRADQHRPVFGPSKTSIHRIVCGCSGPNYSRCKWKSAEVGDVVALVRIRNKSPYQTSRYTPGVVAFGRISDTGPWGRSRDDRVQSSITYDDFFFDAPVTPHRMITTALFEPSIFHVSSRACGFGSPLQLTVEQWSSLIGMRNTVQTIAPRTRWDIAPGTDVTITTLEEQHQVRWPTSWRTNRIQMIADDGTITRPPDPRNADVAISDHTPNLFIFGDTSARNVQPSLESDGSMLVWVEKEHANNWLLSQISTGRALRLFIRPVQASTTARYVGQYVIDQHNPIVTNPPASKATGRCLRIHPWGPIYDDPAHWQPNIGQRYRPSLDLEERDASFSPTLQRYSDGKIRIAIQTHRNLQNNLAEFLTQQQLQPLTPNPDEPQFDLAFQTGLTLTVCEVKSLPVSSENEQLRTGFGQVSHYAEYYRQRGEDVIPVLYVERRPADPLWENLCERHGVTLAWPETIDRILIGSHHDSAKSSVIAMSG